VEDDLDAAHRLREHVLVANVAAQELDPLGDAGQILLLAAREVVEHADAPTIGDQPLDEMAADEASASSHQGRASAHCVSSSHAAKRRTPSSNETCGA
jgi:hypothetical protein